MGVRIKMIGDRYGRLVVLSELGRKETNKNLRWFKCLCDCGNIIETRMDALRAGDSQSCGCLREERQEQTRANNGLQKKYTRADLARSLGVKKGYIYHRVNVGKIPPYDGPKSWLKETFGDILKKERLVLIPNIWTGEGIWEGWRITRDHGASYNGQPVLVGPDGKAYSPGDIAETYSQADLAD